MDFPEMLEAVSFLREQSVADRASDGYTSQMAHKVVLKAKLPCIGFVALRTSPLPFARRGLSSVH